MSINFSNCLTTSIDSLLLIDYLQILFSSCLYCSQITCHQNFHWPCHKNDPVDVVGKQEAGSDQSQKLSASRSSSLPHKWHFQGALFSMSVYAYFLTFENPSLLLAPPFTNPASAAIFLYALSWVNYLNNS